jgi:hypothetical protein
LFSGVAATSEGLTRLFVSKESVKTQKENETQIIVTKHSQGQEHENLPRSSG